jgi:hypothetical protein
MSIAAKTHTCSDSVLAVRQNISKDIRNIVRLVTAEPGIIPVGTFRYSVFPYPNDIDIFEDLQGCCEFTTAKLTAAQRIQIIIKQVMRTHKILFVEFKAGYDLRFKIYTGVVNSQIEDYNPALIRRDLENLYTANLLSEAEYSNLSGLVFDSPTIGSVIALNEALRGYWVLRWTQEEVLQGYKVLRGNYKLFLDVAITEGTIVKLDTIAYVDKRFVEVTNFFLISVLDKFGNRTILSEELSDYLQSLTLDVYKYFPIKPLKAVKRLWLYLAANRRLCDLALFTPLFSSEIALRSQIAADIEVTLHILSPGTFPSFLELYGEEGYAQMLQSLDARLQLLQGVCQAGIYANMNREEIVADLHRLYGCLNDQINAQTYAWLDSHGIDIFSFIQPQQTTALATLASEAETS